MSKKTFGNGILGPKALEMVMRDVLGGMEELSVMRACEANGEEYKVIAIKPQGQGFEDSELYAFYPDVIEDTKDNPPNRPAEIIILDEYLKRKKP